MGFAQDLLEQSQFLVRREPGKPKQASLRRAVSTAYYAVFHLLAWEAANQATPTSPSGLTVRVTRSLEHNSMKRAAQQFESGNLPDAIKPLVSSSVPAVLIEAARNFILLQDERHAADYDLTRAFSRARAQTAVDAAARVLANWNAIRDTDDARTFLAALIFPKLASR
ncbi:MAG: hypothetical protein ABSA42_14350 [Terracidiphilus sp.]|jgi:hypothetical protein